MRLLLAPFLLALTRLTPSGLGADGAAPKWHAKWIWCAGEESPQGGKTYEITARR